MYKNWNDKVSINDINVFIDVMENYSQTGEHTIDEKNISLLHFFFKTFENLELLYVEHMMDEVAAGEWRRVFVDLIGKFDNSLQLSALKALSLITMNDKYVEYTNISNIDFFNKNDLNDENLKALSIFSNYKKVLSVFKSNKTISYGYYGCLNDILEKYPHVKEYNVIDFINVDKIYKKIDNFQFMANSDIKLLNFLYELESSPYYKNSIEFKELKNYTVKFIKKILQNDCEMSPIKQGEHSWYRNVIQLVHLNKNDKELLEIYEQFVNQCIDSKILFTNYVVDCVYKEDLPFYDDIRNKFLNSNFLTVSENYDMHEVSISHSELQKFVFHLIYEKNKDISRESLFYNPEGRSDTFYKEFCKKLGLKNTAYSYNKSTLTTTLRIDKNVANNEDMLELMIDFIENSLYLKKELFEKELNVLDLKLDEKIISKSINSPLKRAHSNKF
jgi:hypothetical protein